MQIVISGETGAGKDYIQNYVIKNYGFNKIITTTTRPMRANEINGINYNFISEADFLKKFNNNEFLETVSYNTVFGKWYYGTEKKNINLKNDNIIILDKSGLLEYKKLTDNSCISIFLECIDEAERFYKAIKRLDIDGKINTKDVDELHRRLISDREKFKDIKKYVDMIIPQSYNETTLMLIDSFMSNLGRTKIL